MSLLYCIQSLSSVGFYVFPIVFQCSLILRDQNVFVPFPCFLSIPNDRKNNCQQHVICGVDLCSSGTLMWAHLHGADWAWNLLGYI